MTDHSGASSDADIRRCCAAFWEALQAGAVADHILLELFSRSVIAAATGDHRFEAVLVQAVRAWSDAGTAIRRASSAFPTPELSEAAESLASQVDQWSMQAGQVISAASADRGHREEAETVLPTTVTTPTSLRDDDLEIPFEMPPLRAAPLLDGAAPDWKPVGPPPGDGPGDDAAPAETPAAAPKLVLSCPKCDTRSKVPWNRLQEGRILSCPECRCHFYAARGGRLTEVIRRAGRWVERYVDDDARMRRRAFLAGGGIAASAAVAMFWAWRSGVGAASGDPQDDLPLELEERARLFADAWSNGDARLMARLTDPTMNRSLFFWKQKHPHPHERVGVRIEVQPRSRTTALVRIELEGSTRLALRELHTDWIRRDTQWMFQPVPARRG